jgi:hypothetical protein
MNQKRQSRLAARLHGGAMLNKLGPGLITGAADDDPGGIATYSQGAPRPGSACCGPCCSPSP